MLLAAAPAADHRAQQPPPADEDQQAAAATQRQALQRARALCLAVAAEREQRAAERDKAHERPSYFFDGGVARAYATVTPGNDGAAQEDAAGVAREHEDLFPPKPDSPSLTNTRPSSLNSRGKLSVAHGSNSRFP